MADLIIKPSSGNLVLKDDQNAEKFKIATSSGNITHTGNIALGTVTGATINGATIENAPAGVTTKCFGFSAYLSGGMTLNNATWTEVTGTYTERWDTDAKFASGRFTPTVQGIYLCGFTAEIDEPDDNELLICSIRKNSIALGGSDPSGYGYNAVRFSSTNGTAGSSATSLVQLDTDDYISLWAYQSGGGNDPLNINSTEFWAVYQGQV